jgi:hypothetical protein
VFRLRAKPHGSFVYRFEDPALSRRRDGFDSHTSYWLREQNEREEEERRLAGHHVLMVVGARDRGFDSRLATEHGCPKAAERRAVEAINTVRCCNGSIAI